MPRDELVELVPAVRDQLGKSVAVVRLAEIAALADPALDGLELGLDAERYARATSGGRPCRIRWPHAAGKSQDCAT